MRDEYLENKVEHTPESLKEWCDKWGAKYNPLTHCVELPPDDDEFPVIIQLID
jgi:hypothetical protein